MKNKHLSKHKIKNKSLDNKSQQTEDSISVLQIEKKPSFPFKYQVLIVFLFAFLLNADTLRYGYVLDDGLMITENKFTLKGFAGIKDIMSHDQFTGLSGKETNNLYSGGRYRPMSQVVFAIEYQLFGLNPFVGHFVNLLLYGLLSVMIFLLLQKMFVSEKMQEWFLTIPFIAVILFIAHPIHTEVVANIKSGDEILCMLGGIAVVYFSLLYFDKNNILYLVYSFVLFLFAILSKESAITFMGIVPLTLFFFRKTKIRDHIIVLVPLVASAAIYFFIRLKVFGFITNTVQSTELNHNPFMHATTAERYATILLTWGKYLQLLIFPHPLTHDYYPKQIPIINWGSIEAIVPTLIYAALLVFSLIYLKKKNIYAYGILFFLFTFSIISNLVFDLGLFMNERLIFTSSLGFTVVLAYFLQTGIKYFFKNEQTHRNILLTCLIIILTGYSVKTISRNRAWKDGYSLFMTDVKTSVNSGRCNVIAGYVLMDKAKKDSVKTEKLEIYKQAESYLIKGLSINPNNIGGWASLGEVDIYLENYQQSILAYKNVLAISLKNANALSNLFYVLSRLNDQKKFPEAKQLCELMIHEQPDNTGYQLALAEIYRNMNKLDSAFIILENTNKSKPNDVDVYNRLAEYYGKYKNNLSKAIEYLEAAYKINPKNSATIENMGIVYGMVGNYDKSIEFFKKAIAKSPDKSPLYYNLAQTYRMKKDFKKADEITAQANALKH